MTYNNKKNSAELWVASLFKQAGATLAAHSSKIYFAHRYHNDLEELERGSFGALFSCVGNEQHSLKPGPANAQQLYLETPLSKDDADIIPAAPTKDSDRRQAPNAEAINSQFIVLNCYAETSDTKTFRLGRINGEVIDYLPGQYMTLSITISGQEYKRSYSLASSPGRSKILELTVKRAPTGGLVSNWLNDHLKIGDTLNLKGPFGKFSCVNQNASKILFLAAGSGIVPIMSMLRWLAETEACVDIRLLLSFRTPEDIIYRDELQWIAARYKNVKMAITVTTDANTSEWSGFTGRINDKMIIDLASDLPERTVYLCGPDAFMMACKENLLKLKLPLEKLYCESFTVKNSLIKPENSCLRQPSRIKKGNFRIGFVKSGKTMAADGGISLLELAEKSGIFIEHDCRSGQCGECMIKCLKGKIEMADQAEIDEIDREKGWVYACCAFPASNALLDI